MALRHAQVRQKAVLAYISANEPTNLELLNKFYDLTPAGERRLYRDLESLRLEHEIIKDDEGRYALLHTAETRKVFENLLDKKEQELLRRLVQEKQSGHPYRLDLELLLDKIARVVTAQNITPGGQDPVRYLGPGFTRDYHAHRPVLDLLEQAIKLRQCISFLNRRPTSREIEEVAHLKVEPQFIELRNGTFYLFGYNSYLNNCYHYRVDKISELKILPDKFGVFRNPEKYMIDFEYILNAKVVKGGISNRFYSQTPLETLPDGACRLAARDFQFWVKQEMLRLGSAARLVIAPAGLIEELRAEIEQMQRNYADNLLPSIPQTEDV